MGRSLAQMHELDFEADASLEQMIQGEVNRAMETADARMDLVRQSAQAMERRVSDTVEVLLSLLRYFRMKGGTQAAVPSRPPAAGHTAASSGGPRLVHRAEAAPRPLAAIHERSLPAESTEGGAACGPAAETASSTASDGGEGLATESTASGRGSESATDEPGSEGAWTPPAQSVPHQAAGAAGGCASASEQHRVLERHPLFATRLCYRTEDFFWSWASSRDFRAEADALRQWQRANAAQRGAAAEADCASTQEEASAEAAQPTEPQATGKEESAELLPESIFVDLSGIELPPRQPERSGDAHAQPSPQPQQEEQHRPLQPPQQQPRQQLPQPQPQ